MPFRIEKRVHVFTKLYINDYFMKRFYRLRTASAGIKCETETMLTFDRTFIHQRDPMPNGLLF